jgi:hypothetical protein
MRNFSKILSSSVKNIGDFLGKEYERRLQNLLQKLGEEYKRPPKYHIKTSKNSCDTSSSVLVNLADTS